MLNDIIITTADLKQDYEIIGPIYFQVSDKGLFGSGLSKLLPKYQAEIGEMKRNNLMSQDRRDWGFLWG